MMVNYRLVPRPSAPASPHLAWQKPFLNTAKTLQALEITLNGHSVNTVRTRCFDFAKKAGLRSHVHYDKRRPKVVVVWAEAKKEQTRK